MKSRSIEKIVSPPPVHWVGDGFRVHNFIPHTAPMTRERMSPFILLDYNSRYYFPPAERPRGVGVHPHRGFETVTVAYKGKIAHHDSFGNSGVIGEGEVQWMTASSGLLHKEYHEKEFSAMGGLFQMVQLWVNLPAKFKKFPPKYQAITGNDMGKYLLPDGAGVIEVIAGDYKTVKGPAFTFSPVTLINLKLEKGGKAGFSFPSIYNTCALVIEGSIILNGAEKADSDHFVLFGNDGEDFTIEASAKAIVLIMSGEPINEPIVANGPFVMNTQTEIMKAYADLNRGRFGFLQD